MLSQQQQRNRQQIVEFLHSLLLIEAFVLGVRVLLFECISHFDNED
ncbi:Uncharacterised protein [Klebsiella pneumoniae]|uniref:Uncharacterized protein n=1 Tax=Klebsiella pneumoniae TaxID=573 RepID=A0A377USR8_KLEPN|nr:Uncharacterised protein [Klebsiella pneumoniae]